MKIKLCSIFISLLCIASLPLPVKASVAITPLQETGLIEIILNCKTKCSDSEFSFVLPKGLNQTATTTKETTFARLGLTITPDTKNQTTIDPKPIYDWVIELSKKFNTQTTNAELTIEGNIATHFVAPRNALLVDPHTATNAILLGLKNNSEKISIPILTIKPTNDLSTLNNLGINELVGKGVSKFPGSPNNRRHNIQAGINKLTGLIIKPGEEFSFNEHICPVEKETGYLPELVIKADGTKPEYGGGLCQVSSTIFRAAMNAGLQIVQRKNHSYAVQYYSPQGSDATTYCGGVDFKFKNDLSHAILVWPYITDKNTLTFELWGTRDSRTITLDEPVQFDRKTDGSMKAYWNRLVEKEGQILYKDTFNSTYLPPALFHPEEKKEETPPAVPTTTPVTPEVSSNTPL